MIEEVDEFGVRWSSYDSPEELPTLGGLGGFFKPGMRWSDFIQGLDPETSAQFEALRRSVIKHRIWQDGEWHQTADDGMPVTPRGYALQCSFRAWGDFMAAVWSTALDRDFHYMDFYYGSTPEQPAQWPEPPSAEA